MRRYLQGTLDYACGIYAVINALSCTHSLDLPGARKIFQETLLSLAEQPELWSRFVRNQTDHYWLVRYMLQRWCTSRPYRLEIGQPFSSCLLPTQQEQELYTVSMFLPEQELPEGPAHAQAASYEAQQVWKTLESWLGQHVSVRMPKKVALLRFHRFIPGVAQPVVSHWTTACGMDTEAVHLHDASGEQGALFALSRDALCPHHGRAFLRIVPESIVYLNK